MRALVLAANLRVRCLEGLRLMPKRLVPTEEQRAILRSTGNRVRINARAGTGKTATMQMLAEKLHSEGEKVLYLVYNRSASQEAKAKIPSHVARVATVHSFALRSVPCEHPIRSRKRKPQWANLKPIDLLPHFKKQGGAAHVLAALSCRFAEFFMNSGYDTLSAALDEFGEAHVKSRLKPLFDANRTKIPEAIKGVMASWVSGTAACPHDFYLKLAYKKGWFAGQLRGYTTLLVDEAQDLSPVMLSLIESFDGRAFIVGDSHQQIYQFRHAIDALQNFNHDEEFNLTLSFRFGEPIALLASSFIRSAKGEATFSIRGNPRVQSEAIVSMNGVETCRGAAAILARTNIGLLEAAVGMLRSNRPFALGKSISGLLQDIQDVYWLSRGRNDKVRDGFLASFDSLTKLKEYAEAMDVRSLQQFIRFVEKYGSETPKLLSALRKQPKADEGAPLQDLVLITTIHGAKGLEFPAVVLLEDVFLKLSKEVKDRSEEREDEANMVYVAMTRAKKRLVLPTASRELPINWSPDTVALPVASADSPNVGKPARQVARSSTGPRDGKSAFSWARSSTCEPEGVGSRETHKPDIDYSVGDRVRTAHGPGRITKQINANEFVVALDNHAAKLHLTRSMMRHL